MRDVNRDRDLAGMVRAMIQLAQSLGMTPLAEGVETKGEYDFLRQRLPPGAELPVQPARAPRRDCPTLAETSLSPEPG